MLQEARSKIARRTTRDLAETAADDEAKASPELVPCLLMLAKRTRALLDIKLAALNVAVGQDQMLLALQPEDAMSGCTLADALNVRPSTVSKMLDRLIAKGLLQRFSDPDDARKVRVKLTPAGVAMKARIHSVLAEFEDELIQHLGENAAMTIEATSEIHRILTTRLRRLR